MQEHEKHPLLNEEEFRAQITALGHTTAVAGNTFGAVHRHAAWWSSEPRTSTDVAYRVTNREGLDEVVISLPNLGAVLDQGQKIRHIGPELGQICLDVITNFGPQAPSEPLP